VRHEGHPHRYHVSDVNVHYTRSAQNTFMKKYTKYVIISDIPRIRSLLVCLQVNS
jgi:hypothetical protein